MKKECEQVRQSLPRYLHGHLFKIRRTRIEQHLQQCVVCRSEYEALRRVEETRRILRDINAPEGVVGRVKEGVSAMGGLKKIVYRPLWIAGIIATAVAVYYYVVTPRQLDLEIEKIVKTAPTLSAPTATAAAPDKAQPWEKALPPTRPAGSQPASAAPPRVVAPLPSPKPLIVTITPENDDSAVNRINEVMHGHGQLKRMTFSDTVKEVSGSLAAGELLTLFNRIEPTAKIGYSRKRLESFPTGQPIPFVLRLKPAPTRVVEKPPAEEATPEPPAAVDAPAPSAVQ